jgi:hypothetical protein
MVLFLKGGIDFERVLCPWQSSWHVVGHQNLIFFLIGVNLEVACPSIELDTKNPK